MTPAELRERRQRLGLSQAQLARHLGITKAAVSHWELNVRTPNRWLKREIESLFERLESELQPERTNR